MKIIIWVILGIIYLVSRSKKKKTEASNPKPDDYRPEEKPMSFEDLLREIQVAKAPKPQPQPALAPVNEYKTYDDNLKKEEKPIAKTDFYYQDQDKIYDTYEKAKQEAFYRPSLEETMKLENTVVRFGQFEGYQQEEKENLAAAYAKELQEPASFKKAFILSEILSKRF